MDFHSESLESKGIHLALTKKKTALRTILHFLLETQNILVYCKKTASSDSLGACEIPE